MLYPRACTDNKTAHQSKAIVCVRERESERGTKKENEKYINSKRE